MKKEISGFLSLFGSSATLLCCALPAAVSMIAGGAAVGSLISVFPWLIPISKYHNWIFGVAAVLLLINGVFVFRPKEKTACVATGGEGCQAAGAFSRGLFWFSVIIYGIGFYFAYLSVPIMRFLGR